MPKVTNNRNSKITLPTGHEIGAKKSKNLDQSILSRRENAAIIAGYENKGLITIEEPKAKGKPKEEPLELKEEDRGEV
jgi:hypothetical protein